MTFEVLELLCNAKTWPRKDRDMQLVILSFSFWTDSCNTE